MRLHILSDLHLEFAAMKPPKVDADAVILAGDIHLGRILSNQRGSPNQPCNGFDPSLVVEL